MKAALQNCRIHHRALAGMEWEYSDTTSRWMTCSVMAKSGTNLEREISSKMAMTLFFFLLVSFGNSGLLPVAFYL
jgi:hypothetical protein